MIKKSSKKISNNSPSGFSIIELSIVILIISILVSGGLVASKSAVNSAKIKVTKDRIDLIYKSIGLFTAINKRLPCPARLDLSRSDTSYGNEYIVSNSCGAFSSTDANATNLSYGAVPVRSLGLPIELAEDGFGNKFDYIIDKRFAVKYSDNSPGTDSFESAQSVPNVGAAASSLNIIRIQGPSGTDILNNSILVLMSHGANAFKSWPSSGVAQNTSISATADENANSRDESSNNYDNIFIALSSDQNFDDILLFKTKQQLVMDAGMEFIKCGKSDGNINFPNSVYGSCGLTATLTTSATTNYNISASFTCPGNPCAGSTVTRICGKYGVWGSLSGPCN